MQPGPPPPKLPAGSRWQKLLPALLALLAVGVVVGVVRPWQWIKRPAGTPTVGPAEDPRLTYPTPYRNVHPDVEFVGDAACAGCHAKECTSYAQHPMGRSFGPLTAAGQTPAAFDKGEVHFQIDLRGDRVIHKASRRGPGSQPLYEVEGTADYVLGSGSHGRSYLVNREGFLFQSPISWYSQKNSWDVSPGFLVEDHFDRPILVQCLYCHANDAPLVPHTLNAYRKTFRLHSIGCERCHGPGGLHVQEPLDHSTIVHPGKLPPALREDVCYQCHFQGEARMLRRGRDAFDYRPGLPLPLFWSFFTRPPEQKENKAVSHVEQIQASRCTKPNGEKLGCTSCHDPHVHVGPAERVAYYQQRCLSCHKNGPECSVPEPERHRQQKDDSCIVCHMPGHRSTDIAHTAVTDHRIARRPEEGKKGPPRPLRPGEMPLVYFMEGRPDAPPPEEIARDRALALVRLGRTQPTAAMELGRMALPVLEQALARDPDDLDALAAKGHALALKGRYKESLAVFEQVLEKAPRDEDSLNTASLLAQMLEQKEARVQYCRRVVEVNPWSVDYRVHYAKALMARRQWEPAIQQCRQALRINPANREARNCLITSLARLGKTEQARAEFATLLALTPQDEQEGARRWFEAQLRGAGSP